MAVTHASPTLIGFRNKRGAAFVFSTIAQITISHPHTLSPSWHRAL
jgi:hypothetical protein